MSRIVQECIRKDGTRLKVGDTGTLGIRGDKPYCIVQIEESDYFDDGDITHWLLVRQPNARGRSMGISATEFTPVEQENITLQPLPHELRRRMEQADEEVRNKKFGKHGDTPTDHSG